MLSSVRRSRNLLRSAVNSFTSAIEGASSEAGSSSRGATSSGRGTADFSSISREGTRFGHRWTGAAAFTVTTASLSVAFAESAGPDAGKPRVGPWGHIKRWLGYAPREATGATDRRRIVFVLGGPGSGKGTNCARLVEDFKVVHLSAGDLLRAEIKSGSPDGDMIQKIIDEGKIVPSEITIRLLVRAMDAAHATSGATAFLIDGFPRNDENRDSFERITGHTPDFVLYFECPTAVMTQRILSRGQGRSDDNEATIRKRLDTFFNASLPVVEHYDRLGKVRTVFANRDIDEVYGDVHKIFVKEGF